MSSCSNGTSHAERPTLPPIRDLFYDLCAPHDSPSLTLARLRVTNDCDDLSSSGHIPIRPSSSLGISRHREALHQRCYTPQYGFNEIHTNPQQPLFKPHCVSRSLDRSFEPHSNHVPRPSEGYHLRMRQFSPPKAVTSHTPQGLRLRRHLSSNSLSTTHGYLPAALQYEDGLTPGPRHDSKVSDLSTQNQMCRHPSWPGELSPVGPSLSKMEDERTPVTQYGDIMHQAMSLNSRATEDTHGGQLSSKYECSYCGKGFNRPSSLKIHLNSHTGARPFVCPVESCGRSFSVLSNMRRHARTHTLTPLHMDPSSDDDNERSFSFTGSTLSSDTLSSHSRSNSTASVSSTGPRKSHASDDDTAQDDSRPEKRSRINPH